MTHPAPCLVITLVGMETASQPIRLQRLDSSGYVPGRADTFSIQCPCDIGHINQLKVRAIDLNVSFNWAFRKSKMVLIEQTEPRLYGPSKS